MFIKNKERKEYLTGLTVPEGGKEDKVVPIKELKHLALTMVSPKLRRWKSGDQKQRKEGRSNRTYSSRGRKEDQVVPINQRIETSSIDNGFPKVTKEEKWLSKTKKGRNN